MEAKSLESIDLGRIMECAYHQHICIPAFNAAYLPMIEPIVETLKVFDCFALVEVARPDIERFGAGSFKEVAEEFTKYADRNFTRLHQDHVPVVDEDLHEVDWKNLIQEALDLKYDSVMVDGSRLALEKNIKVTREVVDMVHAAGIPVEAELGAVLGHESGPLPPYEELFSSGMGFTRVDEAKRFVEETRVDWLSVAIGNIHGAISGAAKDKKKVSARLNIEHLRELSEAVGIPLVLHGGSGIRQESVLSAIKDGITKINVGTVLRQTYEESLKGEDVSGAQDAVRKEVEHLIKEYYYIHGSATRLVHCNINSCHSPT